eukprot:9074501-Alexandrium_andersonii.AAC.1
MRSGVAKSRHRKQQVQPAKMAHPAAHFIATNGLSTKHGAACTPRELQGPIWSHSLGCAIQIPNACSYVLRP